MKIDTADISRIFQNPLSVQAVLGVLLVILALSGGFMARDYSLTIESGLFRAALFIIGIGLIFGPMYVQIRSSGIGRESLESVLSHAETLAAWGEIAVDAEKEKASLKEALHGEAMVQADDRISNLSKNVNVQAETLEKLNKYLTATLILGTIENDNSREEIKILLSMFNGMLGLLVHSISKATQTSANDFKPAFLSGIKRDPPPEDERVVPYYFAARLMILAQSISMGWYLTATNFSQPGQQYSEYSGDESIKDLARQFIDATDQIGYNELMDYAMKNQDYGSLEESFPDFFRVTKKVANS